MSENEPQIPEMDELKLQQALEKIEGIVREIDAARNKIRAQLQSGNAQADKPRLVKELEEFDRIRKQLKNAIKSLGGSLPPEVSQHRKPIEPLAIGKFVSQACVSFELLEGFHNGSVSFSGPSLGSSGLNPEGTLQRSLVMHFVFLAARLYRLCSTSGNVMPAIIPRDAIENFVAAVEPVVRIRHLNEHGHDPDRWSNFNRKVARYSLPFLGEIDLEYNEELFRWDKTGPWMGDVLLRPIYEAAKDFEKVAGYGALVMALHRSTESN